MREKNLVSVIMPCHNGSRYIGDAINSVIQQTYSKWELIVVDDNSSDKSSYIVRQFSSRDRRIKLLVNKISNGRPSAPRNYGLSYATGQYIAFLDCDDLWTATHLENLLNCFRDPDVVAAYSWYDRIKEDGTRIDTVWAPSTLTYKTLLKDNFIGNLTGIYDCSQTGVVFQKLCGHEDYLMWLEILKNHGYARCTDSIEAYYRIRNGSVSANKLKTVSWRWNILHNELGLNFMSSIYFLAISVFFFFIKKKRVSLILYKILFSK